MALSRQRLFLTPLPGEDWDALARRALPDEATAAAIDKLKSWNLHLVFRPISVITPSDILFVEPPRAAAGA